MTLKNLLVFCLGAAYLSLAHSPAQAAEPAISFYPSKSWDVVPAGTTEVSSAGQTCTVSNEFNNGFIIQMTGSDRGVTNMSIDFRQDAFRAGQTTQINLSIPGTMNRSVTAIASTAQLLVIDLKDMGDFYEAAKKAGVMDFSIQENDFRFYLTGIAGAADRFDKCTAGMKTAPGPARDETRQAKAQQATPPGAYELPLESLDGVAPPPPQRVAAQEIAPPPPMPEVEEINPEKMELSRQLKRPKQRSRFTERLQEEIEREAAGQKAENKMVSTAAESDRLEGDDMTGTFIPPQPETKAVQKSRHLKSPTMKINKEYLEAEVDLTGAGLEDLEPASSGHMAPAGRGKDFTDLRDKIADLERTVNKLSRENAELEDELEHVLKESEQERLAISSENWDLERATMRFNEAERQIERLGRQLQRERMQCRKENEKLETMLFDPAVTNEQQLARLTTLERELEKSRRELAEQRRKYEARIALLEEQLKTQ